MRAAALNRRTLLALLASTTVLTACTSTMDAFGGTPAKFPPPRPERIANRIEQLGRVRNDPYSWIKDQGPGATRSLATLPPPIARHLQAEIDYAERILAPGADEEAAFFAEMKARTQGDTAPPPLSGTIIGIAPSNAGPGNAYTYKSPTEPLTLLDEGERSAGHAYYRTTGHQLVGDRYFVWAEDVVGADEFWLVARDLNTGEARVIVSGGVYGYGGFAATEESIYWLGRNDLARPDRLYRAPIAGGAPELLFEQADPALFMGLHKTAAGDLVVLTLSGPDRSEIWTLDAKTPDAKLSPVLSREDGVLAELFEWNGAAWLLTNANGAADRKVVGPHGDAGALIPHRPGVPIEHLLPFAGGLVWLERRDAVPQLRILPGVGDETLTVDFPGSAYALFLPEGQDYGAKAVRVRYETPASPPEWYDVDLKTGARTLVKRAEMRGVDPQAYRVERLDVASVGGVRVPVTVLRRKGGHSGPSPLLLTGYGAYGISSEAEFSLPALSLVDRGWVYAIAHVRGGGERGRGWFEDGRRFQKHHSFDDFIAVARALGHSGIADPERMVAYGLSAGGLLVGGALNQAPELFAGAIMKVPFVDMLNTMSDADHPLVPLFRPDWGDPLADPDAYDYMASISPYENVKAAPYPPILTTGGLKDDRVAYWEPAKFVAAVRDRSTSDAPAVLDLDPDAGHQPTGGDDAALREAARFWTFADRAVHGDF